MYIAIDRKPENGCEIQNSACSESGLMLRLFLVNSEEDYHLHIQENNEGFQHGTSIFKYLVLPWTNSERGVFADSYFALVSSAEEMMWIGTRFIGVVKTATKNFLWHIYRVLNYMKEEVNRWGQFLELMGHLL